MFKPGDKIDLSKFDKYKKINKKEILNRDLIREQALSKIESEEEYNIEYIKSLFKKFGAPDNFINNDGAINSNIFRMSNGGNLEDEDVDIDEKVTKIQDEQVFLKKEVKDGFLAEKIISIILNKIFNGSNYVIVSSNPYDDNNNGVDQVIININTGETICALDDFVSNDTLIKVDSSKEDRFTKKVDRIINKKSYGARLKYGAIFKDGRFERLAQLKGLPLAVLRVERGLFYKSMRDMDFSISSDQCDSEKKLLSYMINSIEEQLSILVENVNVSYDSVYSLIDFLKKNIS